MLGEILWIGPEVWSRTRNSTKAKTIISILELVNFHTKSIIDNMLLFLPLLKRFCMNKTRNDGEHNT